MADLNYSKKLAPFVNDINTKLHLVGNIRTLFIILQNSGYKGSYATLYRYITVLPKNSIQKNTRDFIRFETTPGEQAQVDWGTCGKIEIDGKLEHLYCFVYVLGYSRMMYVEFTIRQTLSTFIECHIRAFEELGIPSTIVYDNTKTVVIRREKLPDKTVIPHYNLGFLHFSKYYGFAITLCPPYWPRSKGKVEAGVKYVKNSFFERIRYEARYLSLEEINEKVRKWLKEEANTRAHRTTFERPIDRWEKEKKFLGFPLGIPKYLHSPFIERMSTETGIVQYKTCYYNVPKEFSRRKLSLRERNKNGRMYLEIYHQDMLIMTHKLSLEKGQWIISETGQVKKDKEEETKAKKKILESEASTIESRGLDYYEKLI